MRITSIKTSWSARNQSIDKLFHMYVKKSGKGWWGWWIRSMNELQETNCLVFSFIFYYPKKEEKNFAIFWISIWRCFSGIQQFFLMRNLFWGWRGVFSFFDWIFFAWYRETWYSNFLIFLEIDWYIWKIKLQREGKCLCDRLGSSINYVSPGICLPDDWVALLPVNFNQKLENYTKKSP